jgi:hypothetical protein
MRGLLTGAALVSVLGFGLACAGMEMPSIPGMDGGGGAYDNVAACRRYVEAYNNAPCTSTDLPVEQQCPDTLNQTECDLASYYDCAVASVKCNGEMPDLTGLQACGSPTCN